MTLAREVEDLRGRLNEKNDFITIDPEMIRIKEIIRKIAGTDATVLILGESGVGKELIARAIHENSPRREKLMVRVNCAALPSELLESELFGFERGAFTGAMRGKMGKFELANEGTIFLDEIAEMSPGLQAKLLHVLQDGEFSKLGGKKDTKVDVRVVAATNQNLERAIQEGRFREDLYYRLNVVKITAPPLRERREDIPLLSEHFFKKFKRQYSSDLDRIPESVIQAFMTYSWPGNIRELENMIRRLTVLKDEKYILKELNLPRKIESGPPGPSPAPESLSLKEISKRKTAQVERDAILNALIENNWNKKRTAQALNISYRALQYKIKEYGVNR
ncbi:MAG TPA: sigma 54-interacting transcriptional regulator, partial [Candidatus Manganitrophaceae bacterium]